jgi:hypothetical protein
MENEENVELEVNNTSEVENNAQQENTKTYSQEEVDEMVKNIHAQNQKAWDKRWGREKSKMEEGFSKYKEASELIMKQTGATSIDDLLNNAYQQYGVERPVTARNAKDEERLGKLDAQDVLELDYEEIVEEAKLLASISERTPREEAKFMELGKYLTEKQKQDKLSKEIKENGFDEGVINSDDFKSFASKFNDNTSLKDIMDIYSSTKQPKTKPFSAGSAKGTGVKEDSEFFTEEEFRNLTAEDLKNPNIYRKAMQSRYNFK